MKSLLLILVFGTTLQNRVHASQGLLNCDEWREKLLLAWDRDAVTEKNLIPLRPGHSVLELLSFATTYPGVPSVAVKLSELQKDPSHDEMEIIVRTILEQKDCGMMFHYELVRGLLTAKSLDQSKKAIIIRKLLERSRTNQQTGSLVGALLDLNLIEIALEESILKVSDAMYLELGSILLLAKKTRSRILQQPPTPECKTSGEKKCTAQQIKLIYDALREELLEVHWIRERLQIWARRIGK